MNPQRNSWAIGRWGVGQRKAEVLSPQLEASVHAQRRVVITECWWTIEEWYGGEVWENSLVEMTVKQPSGVSQVD